MSDSALRPETTVPNADHDAVSLTPEQREQVTAKLKELARGMNDPDAALNPLETMAVIDQDQADVGPHSSHYDNDGWF